MNTKNTGGPAFPSKGDEYTKRQYEAGGLIYQAPSGMTLRDYFAANINIETELSSLSLDMGRGLLGRECPDDSVDSMGFLEWWAEYRAIVRFIEADAMLKARGE